MPLSPEQHAREEIDQQLLDAGWVIQNMDELDLSKGRGIAIREFPLKQGHGEADYLLYGDGKALGVIEAKKEGETLTGVEVQTEKYSTGLPNWVPAWQKPLPFLYESTGSETRFTNGLDPDPRSRWVFSFHRPETLIAWAQGLTGIATADRVREQRTPYGPASSVLGNLQAMPPLVTDGMRSPQIKAINNLERSLAQNRPRALIQMTGGAGKTYTSVAEIYRLIKYAGAKRVLFLVDRSNLARQTLREFQQYTTPDDGRKFTELYNVQHLKSNTIDPVSRVCITTIQRLYSILKGEPDLDPEVEELSAYEVVPTLRQEPLPVVYNPNVPIETFDFVFTDECHRSIYNLWRQALEYFDAYLIGLTATPSKQTFGFFNQNLVMEYPRAEAVADGVCVDFDVYRIRTRITESGSTVEAGMYVDRRDKRSRKLRWEQLEDDLDYAADELDRSVVSEDQIRTVIRTFRDKLFTEIFPGRKEVPKTLIFAKDDSHADDIVRIAREEFGKGNDFCQKITYRSSTAKIVDPVTGEVSYKSNNIKTEDLLSAFRNSFNPRIAVTVDMIATGTDVKPLEIVFFMRDVKSGNYFEQMNMRGARTIPADDLRGVTPDTPAKTRYVIVDAVGVCEREHSEALSLDRQPSVPLKRILAVVSMGNTEDETVSTLAARLARLDRVLSHEQREYIETCAGQSIQSMASALVASVDVDLQEDLAKAEFVVDAPSPDQIEQVAQESRREALKPFRNADLRQRILTIQQDTEQTIDRVSVDVLLSAGHSEADAEKARSITQSFAQYLQEHRDEITAIQILYSRPKGKAPTLAQLKELAMAIQLPPYQWTPERLWYAYEMLEKSKVHGSARGMVTDLISLVRFALEQETILSPFSETVNDRFARWLTEQQASGTVFTREQMRWLSMIRDHIAASLTIEREDFELTPFSDQGGLGKAYSVFGDKLFPLLDELNEVLVA